MPGAYYTETTQNTHKGAIELFGSFRPNGSSAVSVIIGNWISSVAHSATGKWTLTMKSAYRYPKGVYAILVSFRTAAASVNKVHVGTLDLDAGTIVVWNCNSTTGAAADIASAATSWIDIYMQVQRSPIIDGGGITT